MEIEPEFMRPAILHGFGTSAKKRLSGRLTELAHYGWMPLAAALFGTVKWQPQWLHHNFLPVIGLRVHAKVPPSPLTDRQLVALLGLWKSAPSTPVSGPSTGSTARLWSPDRVCSSGHMAHGSQGLHL